MDSENIMFNPIMPLLSSVSIYIFLRLITKYGTGTMRLNNGLRKLLLPFSKYDMVSSFFVPVALCCYFVTILFLAKCVFPIDQYISVYDFNILCASLFSVAFSVPMLVDGVHRIIIGNVGEKIVYAVSALLFFAFAVIGTVNSIHIIDIFINELLLS